MRIGHRFLRPYEYAYEFFLEAEEHPPKVLRFIMFVIFLFINLSNVV